MKKLFPICVLFLLFGCKKETVTTPYVPFVYTDSISDSEGNYYHTITIGGQVWMAENLRSTRYQNGDTIVYKPYSADWSSYTFDAYCYYDNNSRAESIYGKLYNYRVVSDPRNICPVGWHIPSQYEWQALLNYYKMGATPGDKLREHGSEHWFPPNANATDEFGFAALPGGWCNEQGQFENVRHEARFWSSSNYILSNPNYLEAWSFKMVSDLDPTLQQPNTTIEHIGYLNGCAIRCIKD
jgi:uncharacterized protein (TIGR02145 family)